MKRIKSAYSRAKDNLSKTVASLGSTKKESAKNENLGDSSNSFRKGVKYLATTHINELDKLMEESDECS